MIRCSTLFDISRNNKDRNQLRNWHTLIQSIGLKSTPTIHSYPKKIYRNIDEMDFGNEYVGFHNIWLFDFELDNFDGDLITLANDIDFIPMIIGLDESVKNMQSYTISHGSNKNICFLLL